MADIYVKSQQAGEGTPNSGTYRGIWTTITNWAVGDRVVGVATVNYYVMECTTGGTGGVTEPVWSTTPGNTTNDGTAVFTTRLPSTWANATLDLTRAANDAAGDFIYVSDTHAQSTSTAISLAWAGTAASPTRILCVDDASGEPPTTLATTATVTTTGSAALEIKQSSSYLYCYGISFICGEGSSSNISLTLNGSNGGNAIYENCVFNLATTSTSARLKLNASTPADNTVCIDCDFQFSSTSQGFVCPHGSIIGGSILSDAAVTTLFTSSGFFGHNISVSGLDMTNCAAAMNIANFALSLDQLLVRNCKLPASWSGSITSATPSAGSIFEMHNADSTDTNYRYQKKTQFGIINSETTLVRTGGASDGATTISWKMASNADAEWSHQTLDSGEIVRWNETTGSAITATIEILHDSVTALTDKEIWVEVQYLGTSGFPLGAFIDDAAANYLSSAANQTTSSETWTTSGMSNPNKQKLAVTFTPQEKGFIHATVKLAKASYTVYVDPKIVIS